tara:strand:- start:46 stop:222 length:177 start_codon:yes stop_codon:yes gene_type:complete
MEQSMKVKLKDKWELDALIKALKPWDQKTYSDGSEHPKDTLRKKLISQFEKKFGYEYD